MLVSIRRSSPRLLATVRTFQSASGSKDSTEKEKIELFLRDTAHIKPELHSGLLHAIKSSFGRDATLNDVESLGKDGLRALIAALENEYPSRQRRKSMPTRTLRVKVPHHRTEFDLSWRMGESIYDVAKSPAGSDLMSEYMEGTCGGQMSCCTCHIYLESSMFARLQQPTEGELDMLDLAFEPREGSSRLACQVCLDESVIAEVKEHEPFVVTIPEDVNNMWN